MVNRGGGLEGVTRKLCIYFLSKYFLHTDLEREKGGIWGEIDNGVVPSPHLVLPGHRSIANQIRYSSTHHLLCSSGVEKIIKVKCAKLVLFNIAVKTRLSFSACTPLPYRVHVCVL